jgi:hypothetical protein
MAGYIPSNLPRKKDMMLKRREEELLQAIRAFSKSDRLSAIAEKVREAQLGYLKAKKYFAVYPNLGDVSRSRKIDLQVEKWRRKTPEEIIDMYYKVAKAWESSARRARSAKIR